MSVSPLTEVRTDTLVDLGPATNRDSASSSLATTPSSSSSRNIPLNLRRRYTRSTLLSTFVEYDDDPFGLRKYNADEKGGTQNREDPNIGVLVQIDSEDKGAPDSEEEATAAFDWDLLKLEAQSLAGDLKKSDHRLSMTDWALLESEAKCVAGDFKSNTRKASAVKRTPPLRHHLLLSMDKFSPAGNGSPILALSDDSGAAGGKKRLLPDNLLVNSSPDSPVKPVRLFKPTSTPYDGEDVLPEEQPAKENEDPLDHRPKCGNCQCAGSSEDTTATVVIAAAAKKPPLIPHTRKPLARSNHGTHSKPVSSSAKVAPVISKTLPRRPSISSTTAAAPEAVKKPTSLPSRRSFLATPTRKVLDTSKSGKIPFGINSSSSGSHLGRTPSFGPVTPSMKQTAPSTPLTTPVSRNPNSSVFQQTPVSKASSLPNTRRSLLATPLATPMSVDQHRPLYKPATTHREAFKPRQSSAVKAAKPLMATRQFAPADVSQKPPPLLVTSTPASTSEKPRRRVSGLPSPIRK